MAQLIRHLTSHAARYPRMHPQDAVKLIYQNEFGGGHLIPDPAESLRRLREEHAGVKHDPTAPLWEDIGNGLVRVLLAAVDTQQYPLEELNEAFVRSAALHTGERGSFLHKLDVLRELTRQGVFSFSEADLEEYLATYLSSGCPAVSHSRAYREAYAPAYRVVSRTHLPVSLPEQILRELPAQTGRTGPLLVAIDGRCASGKTTLAAQLQAVCGCGVVHLDDFFLRPEQRTPERYETPGENVDHERFLEEVLLPLRQGKAAEYRPFDCSLQQLTGPVRVESLPIVVVEGSYSLHPDLRPFYDFTVFLSVSPQEQLRRIAVREGTAGLEVFRTRWIPQEEQYFAAHRPQEYCDLIFDS